MQPFTLFAPAKVNLALHVLGRRADGYHDLDSVVAFADVGDRLTFTPADDFTITLGGPFAAALPQAGDNIIAKSWAAARAIAQKRGRALPPVQVHLEKNLPVASGIGGGSANAAAALKGFLRLAGITEIDAEIAAAGLAIGADVPVCLSGVACRMQGVGERITPLVGFTPLRAILVNPLVEVSTPAVFRGLALEKGQSCGTPVADLRDPARWRNDLASPAIALAPVIGEVLTRLAAAPGVTRAFMSGSGATCVALCTDDEVKPELETRWWVARTVLR
ncbi:4-(cytidine 5'-diphospho)-2-C-methyl-D-erythritol kinase [Aestuariivirga litoralis]|uniref:4-diphosphocytidyl-2-C-methyl-D-erythritol kinase n=1 Tax=Aestuariivirga litoralis TaxID=2650924 RepID=A0A2W2B652_9HYPH|nr:4-(cytidine 5'-diphospho)-2-C-methyl-D-erythritol kinase [Aestuariivirga litoralis]PZF75608.1 4-(cytidine 5'-diphospho)-2-C-methyl-D-erythritol kinase [Aestuariivirga litoralis]